MNIKQMITKNPCYLCPKRSTYCRLSCGKYKVYHSAMMKIYIERAKKTSGPYAAYLLSNEKYEKRRRHSISFAPVTNGRSKP